MSFLKNFDFGNEAGDDVDVSELKNYFVEQDKFTKYKNVHDNFYVSIAKKGVGKSALLQWIGYSVEQASPDDICIKVRGSEVTRASFNLKDEIFEPNEYIHDWMVRICGLINREIAKRIDFALTDDQITLVEYAEITGYKSRNLVGCLIKRFSNLLGKLAPTTPDLVQPIETLKRLQPKSVWILIDDLDATFQNTEKECLSLSTFFSACRYLLKDIDGLKIRVTVRSDVWATIRRYDESLDKIEQYVEEIDWSLDDFKQLLINRAYVQAKQDNKYNNFCKNETILPLLFEPKIQWGEKNVPSYKVIYTLSYQRPRWAIQLCKLAQKNAISNNAEQINKINIDNVWGEYGSKRIADLVAEHKHQCKDIEELVLAFRNEDRKMNRDDLFKLIKNKILEHMNVYIDGKTVKTQIEIARFLYRIGFLVARADDENGYHHYNFRDMPDLLISRTNNDFNIQWEIHPCYREALDIKKINRAQRQKRGV